MAALQMNPLQISMMTAVKRELDPSRHPRAWHIL